MVAVCYYIHMELLHMLLCLDVTIVYVYISTLCIYKCAHMYPCTRAPVLPGTLRTLYTQHMHAYTHALPLTPAHAAYARIRTPICTHTHCTHAWALYTSNMHHSSAMYMHPVQRPTLPHTRTKIFKLFWI